MLACKRTPLEVRALSSGTATEATATFKLPLVRSVSPDGLAVCRLASNCDSIDLCGSTAALVGGKNLLRGVGLRLCVGAVRRIITEPSEEL